MPGTYTVSIAKEQEGVITEMTDPVEFEVINIFEGALKGMDPVDAQAFRKEVNLLWESTSAASITFAEAKKKAKAMQVALSRMPAPAGNLYEELYTLKRQLAEFGEQVWGDPAKWEISVYDYPSVSQRLRTAAGGFYNLTYGPTETQIMCLEIAKEQFNALKTDLKVLLEEKIPVYEQKLIDAGAPWMNGMPLK